VKFRITILSDVESWLSDSIASLVDSWKTDGRHIVKWVHNQKDIPVGNFCFILGYTQKVKKNFLKKNQHNLVVHESSLPQGKGWSPLSWQILEGKNVITITLFEAEEDLDSGAIYIQEDMKFEGHELVNELRHIQSKYTIKLCKKFVSNYPEIVQKPIPKLGVETSYPRRHPVDSVVDHNSPISDQFNLLRIVDNDKYPAYFEMKGYRYELRINKILI
jgi:methionyl-tRNA formyltransferase